MFATRAIAEKESADRKSKGAQKSAGQAPASALPFPLLQRKANCACGGGCPSCQQDAHPETIQTKLQVSSPGDQYEQEADRVAEQVMRMPESSHPQISDLKENPSPHLSRHPSPGASQSHNVPAVVQDALSSPGQQLDASTRAFMEPRFGHNFGQVLIHTGPRAAESASAVKASAYTVGRDIVFGAQQFAPETAHGKTLLAHELAHVVQQGGAGGGRVGPLNQKPGPSPVSIFNPTSTPGRIIQRRVLTPVEETAAINSGRGLFNSLTVRVLQTITGVPAANRDGVIGRQTVRAISDWQTARGLADTGIVDQATMDRLVTDSLAGRRAEHGIQLVLDFFNLNTATDVLTVRHRTGAVTFEGFTFMGVIPVPNFSSASTTFEEGNLRVIEVDDLAFTDATELRDTIQRELARPAPALPPVGAIPARLNPIQVRNAVRFTASKYSDERSVRAIQGLVGAPVTGIVDATTVQFVAEAQHTAGIRVDGEVGIVTTENFYTQMIARGHPNSALRLLVDFFDMRDDGNLLTVFFDPTIADLAATDFRPSEPVRVRVGPDALTLPFSGAVHNIAHELEHVRRLRAGIVLVAVHEFLAEGLEVLSVGMPEEPLDPVNPTHDAFILDATRCLDNWNAMPVADRRTFRNRFIAVRRKVLQRIDAGTAAQRAAHAALRARYVAVVLP